MNTNIKNLKFCGKTALKSQRLVMFGGNCIYTILGLLAGVIVEHVSSFGMPGMGASMIAPMLKSYGFGEGSS